MTKQSLKKRLNTEDAIDKRLGREKKAVGAMQALNRYFSHRANTDGLINFSSITREDLEKLKKKDREKAKKAATKLIKMGLHQIPTTKDEMILTSSIVIALN